MQNTEAKHTPGPWTLRSHSDEGRHQMREVVTVYNTTDAEDGITHVVAMDKAAYLGPDGAWEAENHANAQLIAAAPELLASLEDTVQALEYWFERNGDPAGADSQMMQNARAAIAKARQV